MSLDYRINFLICKKIGPFRTVFFVGFMRCGCSGQAAQEIKLAGGLGDDALWVGVKMEDFFCC